MSATRRRTFAILKVVSAILCWISWGACDQHEVLVQEQWESFYITAMGCEVEFETQGLQAAGAGGL